MKFFKKNKLYILAFLVLAICFFVIRIPSLTIQPIFADEAIYVRWAQIMRAEPTLRFVSLQDGKTPLFMWLLMPLFKVFSDPLFASRFLSVIAGFTTFLGVSAIGWRYLSKTTSLMAAFLITFTPMIVFFDRMALVDSMLVSFSVWSLFLGLLLIEKARLDVAMILGFVLGGGMLTKTSGLFSILTVPVTFLTLKRLGVKRQQWVKTAGLFLIAIIIALGIYNFLLRLGPGFENLSSRNGDYLHSPSRLLQYPFDPFKPHLNDLVDWFPKLLTWPILGLLALSLGVWVWVWRRNSIITAIFLWGLLPLLAQMFLLKTFTARYILFSIPPALMMAAWGFDEITRKLSGRIKRVISIGVPIVILFSALIFIQAILTDPEKAALPREERQGYLEDWTAGYGLREIADYLKSEAIKTPIVVGTEGTFGTLPDGLWIYLDKTPNIFMKPGGSTISAELRATAKEHPTFFVANRSRIQKDPAGTELLLEFPKAEWAGKRDAMLLFKVEVEQ
ncbi:hypothetical protein A2631_03010 [Candidatus Daviesbacteria bacterium RIFCSPHIGHO2_01_FULL_44_29]|uniref:Glycosyltransferase RgtA/B/C/D-like domain-containing protein n=1 Tax=Candidatus Daviesbacteria bacterium RIFCSPHIGHO2_02_FULL_43_12 TaxID=1797776 RepID=A0A1F5KKF4_9BACT|nr:MAG: hypothetical protein A2631_03010 [Candidatus Daviesbacteria bacterium RIFCSPHIGHO2_01_FULL_44_29]OGE40793.1 MAG: hypothetical protein A3E86_02335 [Candidatus Daviesbacteria bacterium RIFCSPHIGHO2_12_FULL_47_45]OGE41354.1 MAG: hypothetical protein A3D25_02405 [Candidatus Daviesbacteria bacterium RIFCSPHIGHO2_02_FULL_43_12]OGE69555.1 MAG: hypothetical protein A3B55_04150 [Candidatus Daviesbacteria bacterium RIFCSPLOWO2_01_FULL_43_15]